MHVTAPAPSLAPSTAILPNRHHTPRSPAASPSPDPTTVTLVVPPAGPHVGSILQPPPPPTYVNLAAPETKSAPLLLTSTVVFDAWPPVAGSQHTTDVLDSHRAGDPLPCPVRQLSSGALAK